MRTPRFSPLEQRILDVLWERGRASIREIQEALQPRPAYSTVQTTVYRLEAKGGVRRARKIGNAHIFEAAVTRAATGEKLIDQVLALFGGRIQPVMAHWAGSRKVTAHDLAEAEALLREFAAKKANRPRRRGAGPREEKR